MNFAYPEFLFALAAISVPIIIHLFNFRRFKKIYFSDIRFLKNVEIETRSRNQLKNLLILLARILAIACLVLAFAQPVIPTSSDQGGRSSDKVIIYIDNSFSMNASGETGTLLEEATAKALEIASVYSTGADLRLLTNDFDPRHFRNLSWEEFKNEVTSIEPTARVRTLQEVLSRAQGSIDVGEALSIHILSDLQRNTSSLQEYTTDSLSSIYVIPIESEVQANIYIDSCWFSDPVRLPQQPDVLNVRVRNVGSQTVENLSVRLKINGVQRAVGTVNVQPQTFENLELSFTNAQNGLQLAEVELTDYPITYDDHYYLSYGLASTINVLNVTGDDASDAINRMFEKDANFNLISLPSQNIDYSALLSTDLLICNGLTTYSTGMIQEFMQFVSNGGDMLVLPSENNDLSSLNELLLSCGAEQFSGKDSTQLKVEGVNLQSTLYKHVFTEWEDRIDLPKVSSSYPNIRVSNSGAERLLTLENGQPLLSAYAKNKGRVYVLNTVLKDTWTNFHRHALFVPTLYNMALNSVANNISSETIGSEQPIATEVQMKNAEVLKLSNIETKEGFVPEVLNRGNGAGILVHGQVKTDGHYLLTLDADTVQSVSFNYDRTESSMDFYSPQEFSEMAESLGITTLRVIESGTENLANTIKELDEGRKMWKIFLMLALLFLLIETILIRFA